MRSEKNQIAPPWTQTRYILVSSFSFLLPAMVAWKRRCYMHAIILILSSLISANYWRDAKYGWRRTLDLHFAKFAFTVFFAKGLMISAESNISFTLRVYLSLCHEYFLHAIMRIASSRSERVVCLPRLLPYLHSCCATTRRELDDSETRIVRNFVADYVLTSGAAGEDDNRFMFLSVYS